MKRDNLKFAQCLKLPTDTCNNYNYSVFLNLMKQGPVYDRQVVPTGSVVVVPTGSVVVVVNS